MLASGLLMDANDLGGLRGIQRLDLVGGLDALAADDQVVFAAQFGADFLDGRAHGASVLFLAEIGKGFIRERGVGHAGGDGRFHGSHKESSRDDDGSLPTTACKPPILPSPTGRYPSPHRQVSKQRSSREAPA
jgi:hypothetical protein